MFRPAAVALPRGKSQCRSQLCVCMCSCSSSRRGSATQQPASLRVQVSLRDCFLLQPLHAGIFCSACPGNFVALTSTALVSAFGGNDPRSQIAVCYCIDQTRHFWVCFAIQGERRRRRSSTSSEHSEDTRKVARKETEDEREDLPHLRHEDSKPDKKEKDEDLPDLVPKVSKPTEADKEAEATDNSTGPQPVAAAAAGQEGLLHYINFASSESAETVHTKPKPNTVCPTLNQNPRQ